MATFAFDERYAKETGDVNAAVFINRLIYWLRENRANNRHYCDGRWWSYNTYAELSDIFSWLSDQQIRRMVKRLEADDVIMIGHYAKNDCPGSPPTRTNWYAFVDESKYLDDAPSVDSDASKDDDKEKRRKPLEPLPSVDSDASTPSHVSNSTLSRGRTLSAVENLAVENLKAPPKSPQRQERASSVPEDKNRKTKPDNLPDLNNPAYAHHRQIVEAAYAKLGQTPTKDHLRQAMATIDECTGSWPLDMQERLLPLVIDKMFARSETISYLPGFLRYKGSGMTDKHPYGEVLADERQAAAEKEQAEKEHEPVGPMPPEIGELIRATLKGKTIPATSGSPRNAVPPGVEQTNRMLAERGPVTIESPPPRRRRKRKAMTQEERRRMILALDPGDTAIPVTSP